MKKLLVLTASLLSFSLHSQAQTFMELPNNSFDNWSADGYNPVEWSTIESVFDSNYGCTEKETADKVHGAASMSLISQEVGGRYAFANCGSAYYSTSPHGIVLQGIPYTDRPDSLWILYKSIPLGIDKSGFLINLYRNVSGTQEGILQLAYQLNPSPSWKLYRLSLKDKYLNSNVPDSILFTFYSSTVKYDDKKVGTKLMVDGIFFNAGSPTVINEQNNSTTISVYPNPGTGDRLNIGSDKNLEGCSFELHSINGSDVLRTPLTNGSQQTINTASLPTGMYLWLLVGKEGNIIHKGKWTRE